MLCNNINCIVTGASTGIGRQLSLILAEKGCTVLAIARSEEKLSELALEALSLKGTIVPIVFDLTDFNNFNRLASIISENVSNVDLLVNNAGSGNSSLFSQQTIKDIKRVLDVTLIAPILITQTCLPLMKNGNRSVMFVSSLAGKMAFPKLSTYSAAKHGIEGFVDALIQERELDVFIFRPGVTDTNFFENSGMQQFQNDAKKQGLIKDSKEVAAEIIFAIENNKRDYTVGTDKYLLLMLPFISRNMRFTLLDILNRIYKVFK